MSPKGEKERERGGEKLLRALKGKKGVIMIRARG
jgi:hypothetical protein